MLCSEPSVVRSTEYGIVMTGVHTKVVSELRTRDAAGKFPTACQTFLCRHCGDADKVRPQHASRVHTTLAVARINRHLSTAHDG
jgi:hypothetical protein